MFPPPTAASCREAQGGSKLPHSEDLHPAVEGIRERRGAFLRSAVACHRLGASRLAARAGFSSLSAVPHVPAAHGSKLPRSPGRQQAAALRRPPPGPVLIAEANVGAGFSRPVMHDF